MKVFNKNIEFDFEKPNAICIGFFDGVHLGHQKLISMTVNEKQNGLNAGMFTFEKHPKEILSNKKVKYITSQNYKKNFIEQLGIDFIYEADFNSIKDMTPEEFVEKILFQKLNAKKIFCGFNFTYGKNGVGNAKTLSAECKKFGIEVIEVPPVEIDRTAVSSTAIRNAIKSGDIKKANKMLGRNFCYITEVMHGQKLGRTLGAPTINQIIPPNTIYPRFGVYASIVTINGIRYSGVSNIGLKPTVGCEEPLSETYMPDYHGKDLYGEVLKTEFVEFIRDEVKFENIDILKTQIHKDVRAINKVMEKSNGK